MLQNKEPAITKTSACPYCGDAPLHHGFNFFENFVSGIFEVYSHSVIRHVPNFVKRFVDLTPKFLFNTLHFFGLVEFSDDINRAHTFRSRVIWEEAKRRGIKMEQVIFRKRPLDYYRARIPALGKNYYFESIPIQPEFLDMQRNWDDKIILKRELARANIPVPKHRNISMWGASLEKIFSGLEKPIIVKPRRGSRGRHTTTNINTLAEFKEGIKIARQITPHLVAEEHLVGSVCRATFVGGELVGFYRGDAPTLLGDGEKTILELIKEKDANRPERVEAIKISREVEDQVRRAGYQMSDIIPEGKVLPLLHRTGRLFGGHTREMLSDLHPSFVPILKNADKVVGLSVVGFDCIVPDPTLDASTQRWGIIECNTLPFIDLHYYALEGKPQNIAGKIWDLWK